MTLSSALNNAGSGLIATSRMAEVVSSNVANALTDGYGRRSVELSSAQLGGLAAGVRVDGIQRHVDPGLLADRRLADAAQAGADVTADTLQRLDQALGQPGDPTTVSSRIAAVEASLISAGADPASDLRLQRVVDDLAALTRTLGDNTRTIQSLRQEADAGIAQDVDVLNTTLKQLENLNKDMLRLSSLGEDISGLLDTRDQMVDQIAAIVPVRQVGRADGTIGLMTTSGTTLLDGRAVTIGFEKTPTITADMTLGSGALSGLSLDGVALDPEAGIRRFDGGSLGAQFALRDQTLIDVQSGLDNVAADLIVRFGDPANDPTIATGAPGLLTDLGGAYDSADTVGLAGRLSLNTLIDPTSGGAPSAIRDGLYAAAAGAVGDATQITRWIDALAQRTSPVAGMVDVSAADRAAAFSEDVAGLRLNAEDNAVFQAARTTILREAQQADGVDSDQELQQLLAIEQAYAANARVIQTVDFMMQRLLEI